MSRQMMGSPPRLARFVLQRLLHPEDRDCALSDLDEEFEARAERSGRREARRWYWEQVRSSAWPAMERRSMVRGVAAPTYPRNESAPVRSMRLRRGHFKSHRLGRCDSPGLQPQAAPSSGSLSAVLWPVRSPPWRRWLRLESQLVPLRRLGRCFPPCSSILCRCAIRRNWSLSESAERRPESHPPTRKPALSVLRLSSGLQRLRRYRCWRSPNTGA